MTHVKIITPPYDWEKEGDFQEPIAKVIDLDAVRRAKSEEPSLRHTRVSSALSIIATKPSIKIQPLDYEIQ